MSRTASAFVLLLAPAVLFAGGSGPPKVGEPAPALWLYYADGNIVLPKSMEGKYLLLTFWTVDSLRSKEGAALFDSLKQVRRSIAGRDDFVLVSVCVDADDDDKVEAWSRFLLGQGAVDYGDGRRRFIDDSRWWGCTEIPLDEPASRRYRVARFPELFLIGPDAKLLAADIPSRDVAKVVAAKAGK